MTTSVDITYTKGQTRTMRMSFGDDCTGYSRCIGAAHQDPLAEDEPQMTVRLLGAAFMQALEQAIPRDARSERGRLANVSKTHAETAVMYAVKALYADE